MLTAHTIGQKRRKGSTSGNERRKKSRPLLFPLVNTCVTIVGDTNWWCGTVGNLCLWQTSFVFSTCLASRKGIHSEKDIMWTKIHLKTHTHNRPQSIIQRLQSYKQLNEPSQDTGGSTWNKTVKMNSPVS
jgi:hypothetical protein